MLCIIQIVIYTLWSGQVYAGPQVGVVVRGEAVIDQSGPTTSIRQSSSKAIINWQDFSIEAGESVSFIQPNQSSITLNRVLGSNISTINGLLEANGTLFLINRNGIVFGAGSRVNVGGFLASTFDISDDDFLAERYQFNLPGASDAAIINHGQITIADAGLAAFVAPHIVHDGVISANLGRVALAAGQTGFALDLYGDNLIRFALPDEVAASLDSANSLSITANGLIQADGGQVLITAETAREVVSSIITVGGEVRARSIGMDNGTIILSGQNIYLDGLLDASSDTGQGGDITVSTGKFEGMAGGELNVDGISGGTIHLEGTGMVAFSSTLSAKGMDTGGLIEVTGDALILLNADVDASGGTQGGTVHLGGEWQGGGELAQARETIIGVGSEVLVNGENGGEIVVWSTDNTEHYGLLQAKDGGQIELSSKGVLQLNGEIEAGAGGEVLLDPKNLIITDTPPDTLAMALKVTSGSVDGTNPALADDDWFGRAVALDGDRLAVGSELDDSGGVNYGAVHLFTGMDTFTSTGLTWQKKLYSGNGASGMPITPGADHFGVSVALDGDLLAVGAHLDDTGSGFFGGELGAVYLFDGVGADFTGLTHRQTINDNSSFLALEDNDRFGVSVALDEVNQRVVVGAYQAGERAWLIGSDTYEGAVYSFNWTGTNYSGLDYEGVLGYGGAGPILNDGDHFGISVALDGDRLAVGARGVSSGRGTVYLFNNLDNGFSNSVACGEIDVAGLGLVNGDEFGMSVALDGDRLAVGAYLDDTVTVTDGGAVYLFGNVGSDFSNLTLYKKLDADSVSLLASDEFGISVALDGDHLAVGAYRDDTGGSAGADRGAVYLFSNVSSVGGVSAPGAVFGVSPSDDSYISPVTITSLLDMGTDVTLQANNNITLTNDIITVAGGLGGNLTFQAGRSIFLNSNIITDNGDLTITANETAANGVVDAYRDVGDAVITMAGGTSIDVGTGSLTATISTGAGNTNTGSGDLTLETITADTVNVSNWGFSAGNILTNGVITADNAGDAIVLRTNGGYVNTAGAGALSLTGGGRYLVFVNDTANITADGLTATPWYNTAVDATTVGIGVGNRFVSAEVATLTITADDQSRTYGAADPVFTQTVTGYINSETSAILSGSAVGSSTATSTTNVGTAVITGSVNTLATDRNYTFATVNGTLTINPALLTVTADNQTKVYGDSLILGTTAFTVSGLVAGESLDSVTLNSIGNYDSNTSAGVTTYIDDISVSGATGGGTFNASNYSISYVAGDLSVTPYAITVTADGQSKIYGDLLNLGSTAFGVTAMANSETIGSVTLNSTGGYDSNTTAGVATDIGDIVASGATGGTFTSSNYVITYNTGDLAVTPRSITVTPDNQSKTYGSTLALGTTAFNVANLANGESIGAVDLASTGSYDSTASAVVGTYSNDLTTSNATGGTFSSANYAITYSTGDFSITPAALTLTANNDSKIYDGTSYSGGNGVSDVGFVNGEALSDLTGTLSFTGTSQAAVNTGGYVLTPTGFTSTNYTISFVDGALTVNPAALTVTAGNQSKIYGDVLNLGTGLFTSSGLIGTETIGTVALNSTGSYDSNTTTAVATYAGDLAASGATGGTFLPSNYTISYVAGDLAVTPRSITVTASNQSKIYGSSLALGTTAFSTANLANAETIGSVTLVSNSGNDVDLGAGVGVYTGDLSPSGAAGGSFDPGNYTINYGDGNLTINRALLNVTANNDSKTYDGLAYSGGNDVIYSGFVNGENSAVLGGSLSYIGSSQGAVGAGGYAITPTGYTAANYTLNYLNGSLAVDPLSINLTADPALKVELTLDPLLSMSVTGGSLATTDTLAEVTGTVGRESGEHTGLYDILLGAGAKAGNYAIAFVADNNAFAITATVEETPVDQNWDTTNPVDVLPPNEDINEILPDYGEPIIADPLDPAAFLPDDAGQSIPVVEPDVPALASPTVVEDVVPEAPVSPVAPEPPVVPVIQKTPPVAPVLIPEPVAITQDEVDTVFLTFEPDGTVTMDYLSGESVVGITTIDISIALAEETLIVSRYNPVQGQSIRFATTVSVVFLGDDGPEFKGGYVIADEGDGLTAIPFAFAGNSYVKPGIALKKISFGLTDREGGTITYRVAVAEHDLLITPENKVAALLAAASPQLIVALTMVEVQKQLDVALDDIEAVFFKMNVY